ncbi:hypothetical protein B0H15DRAFT_788213, partial [Mycena belliarum]
DMNLELMRHLSPRVNVITVISRAKRASGVQKEKSPPPVMEDIDHYDIPVYSAVKLPVQHGGRRRSRRPWSCIAYILCPTSTYSSPVGAAPFIFGSEEEIDACTPPILMYGVFRALRRAVVPPASGTSSFIHWSLRCRVRT